MKSAIYYPILRFKPGEIEAVGHLSPRTQTRIRPIFDFVQPSPKDMQRLELHHSSKIKDVAETWGTQLPFFVDLSRYDPDTPTNDGRHPIEHVFECVRQLNMKGLPVAGPDAERGPGLKYLKAVAKIVRRDQRGAAIRLPLEDFSSAESTSNNIEQILNWIELKANDVDLFLDAESLTRSLRIAPSERDLVGIVQDAIASAGKFRFRTVVFSATSLPEIVGRKYNEEPFRTKRVEFSVWTELVSNVSLPLVHFSDYGVITPLQTNSGGSGIPPSRIRVSTTSELISFRAPSGAYRTLCSKALGDPAVASQVESWGLESIRRSARGLISKGGATQWVARDTNMHVESTLVRIERILRAKRRYDDLVFSESGHDPWLQRELEPTSGGH